jgi:hypothetical protein
MNENNCQVDSLLKIEELKNNLTYIFCKPYKEYYYYYSINNLDNYRIIKQDELKNIINNLSVENVAKIEMLFNRHRSFIFFKESNLIEELNPFETPDLEKLLRTIEMNKELKKQVKVEKENKYETLFKEIKQTLKLKVKDSRRIILK